MVSTKHDSPKKDVSEHRQQLIKELQHKIHEILKKSNIQEEVKKFELSQEEVIRVALNIEILTNNSNLQQFRRARSPEKQYIDCTCICIGTDEFGAECTYCCPCK